ncbi:hypothetical protein [Enhygromyxa salina]|uniref:Uncharacterized protein n=1 Tax=Enhygromyxa salina TaxID=215803 RepID=A0A2S9YNA7_9BACT|nr:hypothetical protein [Enhygromyxa salina]PRQ06568.1 hypothetical protein ENSA7_37210 [Enhygromyxa salina]
MSHCFSSVRLIPTLLAATVPRMHDDETPAGTYKRRVLRTGIGVSILLLLLIGGVFAWNQVFLQGPMRDVITGDSRNAGIEVQVHLGHYLNPDVLVYDLREVGPDKAPIDVFRVFLQYADAMQGERFETVELAFRGETKFVLDGAGFQEIGRDFADENPMYTIRTFPERLRTPDGRAAFQRWEGGALGVLSQQMDDFSEFQDRWYIGES